MNNLKKFSTEAEYGSATLNYPAVSWVTGTDTVHFDKLVPAPNNKVKIAFTTDACGQGKEFSVLNPSYITETLAILNGITVNGEPFTPGSSNAKIYLEANTDYLIEYELKDGVTDASNWFSLTPTEGCSSTWYIYDILFPAQVNEIDGLQDAINNMILESETPPTATFNTSDILHIVGIYVPDSAVNTYKSANVWGEIGDRIHPISQYSGNIPV